MDHTPGQGQYRNLNLYRKTLKGYNNLSDQEIDTIIVSHQQKDKVSFDQLLELCDLARFNHISVASHDDDSSESVDLVCELGVTISEFPVTLEVARTARSRGLMTMAGAPNILLGGSHSGNLSAAEAILDGCIDILCSDYYPAAMLQAVFQMHLQHHLDLPSLVRLVTANPARAVQIDAEYGTIASGKKPTCCWWICAKTNIQSSRRPSLMVNLCCKLATARAEEFEKWKRRSPKNL